MSTLESKRKSWIPKKKKTNKSWAYDARYHTTRWRKYRKNFLLSNPLCNICKKHDKVTPSRVVDHMIPLSKDNSDENFWNGKHQALCTPCNNRKSQTDKTRQS